MEVTFNKTVDATDVTTNYASLFTIDNAPATGATLSADGKTTTVTFGSAEVNNGVVSTKQLGGIVNSL